MRSKKNANQTLNNSLNSLNRNMRIGPYAWTLTFYMISAPLYEAPFLYVYVYFIIVSYEVRRWNGYDMESSTIRIVYA